MTEKRQRGRPLTRGEATRSITLALTPTLIAFCRDIQTDRKPSVSNTVEDAVRATQAFADWQAAK